jgi:hypothetical protein
MNLFNNHPLVQAYKYSQNSKNNAGNNARNNAGNNSPNSNIEGFSNSNSNSYKELDTIPLLILLAVLLLIFPGAIYISYKCRGKLNFGMAVAFFDPIFYWKFYIVTNACKLLK